MWLRSGGNEAVGLTQRPWRFSRPYLIRAKTAIASSRFWRSARRSASICPRFMRQVHYDSIVKILYKTL